MCRPTNPTQHVVVCGAGPTGLLLANLLLQRNQEVGGRPLYRVTLVESRTDLGALPIDQLRATHRSWMIALAGHGLQALRKIPVLYKDYVNQSHVGVRIKGFDIYMGSTQISGGTTEEFDDNESYTVDRNFGVAALSKYLLDTYGNDPNLTLHYETNLQYVDTAKHRVLIRDITSDEETYLPYDLLVGADGSRSVVREALV